MMSAPITHKRHVEGPNTVQDEELSFVAQLLRLLAGQPNGQDFEEEEGNYFLAAGKYYQAPWNELRAIQEAGVPVREIPVVLHVSRHGGIGSEVIAKQRVSGETWAGILSRYQVRPETLYVGLKTGNGKSRGSFDDDVVNLVNLKFATDFFCSSGEAIFSALSSRRGFQLSNQGAAEAKPSLAPAGQLESHESADAHGVNNLMTVLYDADANSVLLSDVDWTALLALAIAYGWEPSGTEAPPAPFGMAGDTAGQPPWDGRYNDAAGQLVRIDDARLLGEALRRAVRNDDPAANRFREVALVLISWTTSGGFIICRETSADAASPQRAARNVWYRAA